MSRRVLAARSWLAVVMVAVSLAANVPCVAEPVANSAPVASDDEGERAPLSLIVNGVAKGDIIAVVRHANVLLLEDDLRAAGVPFPAAEIAEFRGGRYVSLAALASHVTYLLDLPTVTLNLTVDPSLLARADIALNGSRPAGAARADPSGFLTYSLTSDTANLGGDAAAFVQGGMSDNTGTLTASGTYGAGQMRRGLVAYQTDSEAHFSRLTVGDQLVSSDALGANVVLGGIGLSRHFELEPDYAHFPTPGLSGTVLGPTTADVYVNGALIRSIELAPGGFNLNNIPVPTGAGVTQIVLRDAAGNSQTLSGAFYGTRALLRQGLTDYDYHIGFVRRDPFGTDDVYGPPAAIGSYRLGLSNSLTVGGRFERWAGGVDGGPQFDLGLPIGHFSFAAPLSTAFGTSGSALALAYDWSFGLRLSALTQSAHYATPSLGSNDPRTRSTVSENLSLPILGTTMLAVSHTTSSFTTQPLAGQFSAALHTQVPWQRATISLNLERNSGGSILGLNGPHSNASWTIGAQMSFSLGRGFDLSLARTSTAGSNSSTVQIAKDAPSGPGLGYQVSATTGAQSSAAAQIDYHTEYGNIEMLSNAAGSSGVATSFSLNGSLVGFKQGLFLSSPVTSAYALARVPGFRGLPIFSQGQYVGRTDGRDALVVPGLDPYYDNAIGIGELADQLDLIADDSTLKVRPKDLAGVVASFFLRRFHAYTGRIVIRRNAKLLVPAFGMLTLSRAGHDSASDLGSQGQFYLDTLQPGKYAATVTGADSTCSLMLDLPAGTERVPVTSLETITCETHP
jgi:outer membrane usher protein